MRLPRDLSGADLAAALRAYGYELTRQTGSHMRPTTERNGEHHVTIPNHDALRAGTLAAIIGEIADHVGLTRDALAERPFGR